MNLFSKRLVSALWLLSPLLAAPLACNRSPFAPPPPAPYVPFPAAATPTPTITFTPAPTAVITPTPVMTSTSASAGCTFASVARWGAPGAGNGQFNNPSDMDSENLNGTDDVFVLDSGNRRIQAFDAAGNYLGQWNDNNSFVAPSNLVVGRKLSRAYVLDASGSSPATGDLVKPYSIQMTNPTATPGATPAVTLIRDSDWSVPLGSSGLAVDSQGNVYVGETGVVAEYSPYGTLSKYFYSRGSAAASFFGIQALAVDPSGNLFVASGNSVQKLSPGSQLTAQWGGSGSGLGQFTSILSMRTDAQGNVYVLDNLASAGVPTGRIQKFDNNGNFLCYYPQAGTALQGLAFSPGGNLFTAALNNEQILEFTP